MSPGRILLALSGVAILVAMSAVGTKAQPAAKGPRQPVPFSHKTHAGLMQLECKQCHPNPDPGESMRVVGADQCMKCHTTVKPESPAIRLLAAAAADKRAIAWKRVYQIPGYVRFSHRSHLTAGIKCQDCHGKVAQRDRLFREGDVSMDGCMNCHISRGVSIDCTFCHEPLE